MIRRYRVLGCLLGVFLTASSAHAASVIQGDFTSDGITGRANARRHKWDREIVYASLRGGGTVSGIRLQGGIPGTIYMLPRTGGTFPAGTYTLFSMNLGNIDGGSVGFEIGPTFNAPAGSSEVNNLQFRTRAHYSVLYDQNYTEWEQSPWQWGSSFYQTFIATDSGVTRIATRLAGKDDDNNTGYRDLRLGFGIYETNSGPPSTWKLISPVRERFLSTHTDPIVHIFDVNFLSNEVKLIKGQKYAARFWVRPNSQSTKFALVMRPDRNDGYADGQVYIGDSPQAGWDAYAYITNGAPDTVVNFSPTNQESPQADPKFGSSLRYGQTFVASGNGLAGAELMYVGPSGNPFLPFKVTVFRGVGGQQAGPSKTCWSVTDEAQGRAAAFYEKGEVDLVPGATYYIEYELLPLVGNHTQFDSWRMTNDIPNASGYKNRVSLNGVDLPMTIAEYSSATSSSNLQVR